MFIKQTIICLLLLPAFLICGGQQKQTVEMNKIKLLFSIDGEGRPEYEVFFQDKQVVQPSRLGFVLQEDSAFYRDFELVGTERATFDQTWQPVWGETKNIRNHYNEMTIHLRRKANPSLLLDLVFRVFEDGVGFRYRFPKQANLTYFVVKNELTQFNMTGDHNTFWIPGDYDTNEYSYTLSKLSAVDNKELVEKSTDIAVRVAPDPYAVQTPLMMKTANGVYINVHEAALLNYPAMQLHVDRATYSLSSSLVPDAVGNKAYLHAPFSTPWRTIIISDKATDILASKTVLNLNEPSKIQNTSWIKPMKFVGVWWEMQIGKSTWSYSDFADSTDAQGRPIPNNRHGATTANVKRYIDFAAKNGIRGVLVEGWNTGWEDWFGKWKEDVFDFVTPYPDFDINEVMSYAKSKGVSIIMHNETSGSATNYERRLDTAFRFMKEHGYNSVKTGYVGKIIPRGEHHDGQWMINHYTRVAEKGAQYQVMIDVHEPMRPTGLQRTYPNWMASEAARGNEYNGFSVGNAPSHETILPFTRLMGGPMDYTPGIFKIQGYSNVPGRQVHSTLAKQLALYVTLYSPLQMAADLIENYETHMDAFRFIKDVPVDWDDTKIINAEPGEYLTIARKEKNKNNWFAGAITNENKRTATIPLSFLDKGKKYTATVYADAPNADWKNNPEAYTISSQTVTSETVLSIPLAAGGGAAISIMAPDGK
ncbi:glycoside hydrolase family 97 protein [Danxiaibacter flavus]|uniref:Glycoside hydrolase family 97 protein n=2 Tax=Danxiaibacter flavus TaxID=3049108 RepID=A0ABV3ZBW5_9BACT